MVGLFSESSHTLQQAIPVGSRRASDDYMLSNFPVWGEFLARKLKDIILKPLNNCVN